MKFLAAPLFIILLMTQAFSKWVIIAEFNIYRSYIARNLCENRYKPKLHCNGKCILMKKMAAEENQSAPAGNLKVSWETLLFIDNHAEYPVNTGSAFSRQLEALPLRIHNTPFIPDVFRPPLV